MLKISKLPFIISKWNYIRLEEKHVDLHCFFLYLKDHTALGCTTRTIPWANNIVVTLPLCILLSCWFSSGAPFHLLCAGATFIQTHLGMENIYLCYYRLRFNQFLHLNLKDALKYFYQSDYFTHLSSLIICW